MNWLGSAALGLTAIWCAFLAGEAHARGVFNACSTLDVLAAACLAGAIWAARL